MTGARNSATMFWNGRSRLKPARYLCSHLVTLRSGETTAVVNLEEIWESGAVLECEKRPDESGPAEIRCEGITFCGRLTRVEQHEFGWRAEMEFSPLTPWSPERFQPDHMLNPADLG